MSERVVDFEELKVSVFKYIRRVINGINKEDWSNECEGTFMTKLCNYENWITGMMKECRKSSEVINEKEVQREV